MLDSKLYNRNGPAEIPFLDQSSSNSYSLGVPCSPHKGSGNSFAPHPKYHVVPFHGRAGGVGCWSATSHRWHPERKASHKDLLCFLKAWWPCEILPFSFGMPSIASCCRRQEAGWQCLNKYPQLSTTLHGFQDECKRMQKVARYAR